MSDHAQDAGGAERRLAGFAIGQPIAPLAKAQEGSPVIGAGAQPEQENRVG